jgi:hypothetical protein
MKIIFLKDKVNWWGVQKIKFKHPTAIIPNVEWLENNSSILYEYNYWIDEIYSEFSSFAFVWDGNIKAKRKEKKDSVNYLVILINS